MSLAAVKRQIDAMERREAHVLHLHLEPTTRASASRATLSEAHRRERRAVLHASARSAIWWPTPPSAACGSCRSSTCRRTPARLCGPIRSSPPRGRRTTPSSLQNLALNPASEATYRFLERLLGEMTRAVPRRLCPRGRRRGQRRGLVGGRGRAGLHEGQRHRRPRGHGGLLPRAGPHDPGGARQAGDRLGRDRRDPDPEGRCPCRSGGTSNAIATAGEGGPSAVRSAAGDHLDL